MIKWRAPDFRKAMRRDAWQSISLFCAFILGIAAFLERSIPFFITVLILELFALIGTKRSRHIKEDYLLDHEGLWIGNELVYPRSAVDQFALADYGEEKIMPWRELIISAASFRVNKQRMLLPYTQGDEVRSYLSKGWGVREFEYKIGPKEAFMRIFGL